MFRSRQRRRLARELGMVWGFKDGFSHVINTEKGAGIDVVYDPRFDLAKEIVPIEEALSTRTKGFGRKKRRVRDPEGEKIVQFFRDMRNR